MLIYECNLFHVYPHFNDLINLLLILITNLKIIFNLINI